jgi:hypothetical protein
MDEMNPQIKHLLRLTFHGTAGEFEHLQTEVSALLWYIDSLNRLFPIC